MSETIKRDKSEPSSIHNVDLSHLETWQRERVRNLLMLYQCTWDGTLGEITLEGTPH